MEYLYTTETIPRKDSDGNIIYKKETSILNGFRFPETYILYYILKKVGEYKYGCKRKSLYPILRYHPFKCKYYYEVIKKCHSKNEFKIYCDLIGVENIERMGDYEII